MQNSFRDKSSGKTEERRAHINLADLGSKAWSEYRTKLLKNKWSPAADRTSAVVTPAVKRGPKQRRMTTSPSP
jgi:hypothetical protein